MVTEHKPSRLLLQLGRDRASLPSAEIPGRNRVNHRAQLKMHIVTPLSVLKATLAAQPDRYVGTERAGAYRHWAGQLFGEGQLLPEHVLLHVEALLAVASAR